MAQSAEQGCILLKHNVNKLISVLILYLSPKYYAVDFKKSAAHIQI